ncbi:hypothetical protein, partial [Sphingobacterium faecium]|uniref:hypothetical protein n=1 Tax=Sphingobacterium faecium TaxID=34087 RepID=UPI001C99A0B3
VDTAIKAAAANVFAKVFIMSLCYIVIKLHQPHINQLKPWCLLKAIVDSKVGCKSTLPYDN